MINYQNQRGAVLVIGLIVLTIMSLIVVSGMNQAIINEQIAHNFSTIEKAFQTAESAPPQILSNRDVINQAFVNPINIKLETGDINSSLESNIKVRKALVPGQLLTQHGGVSYYVLEIQSKSKYTNSPKTIVTGFARVGAG